jgi:23S rRNA (guanosine2251-2'-O)-methyltransferase
MAAGKTETIFGRNPVYEVLIANRRRVHKLMVAEGSVERGSLERLLTHAKGMGIPVTRVQRRTLDRKFEHHQGVGVEVDPYPYVSTTTILEQAEASGEPPLVLLLDTLQDPQNFGTLLRTAESVGVHGVVIPKKRGVGVTQAVVGASSGASEHLLISKDNLVGAINLIKDCGAWIIGLENLPEAQFLGEVDLSGAMALVVGHEGQGIRRLVRRSCDYMVRLPMRGRIDSLNAAVAGSIALYEIWKARGHPGTGMVINDPAAS